jgi:DNA adenine methylase
VALIRYPGSKEKIADVMCNYFPEAMQHALWSSVHGWEYREPFFGAGAVGFRVLDALNRKVSVWLNDKDIGIVCLWRSVLNEPLKLIGRIATFTPTKEAFYQFKEEDGREDLPEDEIGFRKLALHRLSYSGLGAMSGGPLGGKEQKSKYNVGCRWVPERMKLEIMQLSKLLRKFPHIRITHGDFEPLIVNAPQDCFIYLDPPYYEKGSQLYKNNMEHDDHQRLSASLGLCQASWVLSYDDHPEVRRMYPNADFHDVHLTYTISNKKCEVRPKNREVVIVPGVSGSVVKAAS